MLFDVIVVSFMVYFILVFFFFQAEDGIRDLVRSRGLGDVYKRQIQHHAGAHGVVGRESVACRKRARREAVAVGDIGPVSYTHLTLPTSDLV